MDSRWLHVVFMLTCSPYQDVGVAAAVVTEEDKLRAMIEDETDKNQQARCVYLNYVWVWVYVCGCSQIYRLSLFNTSYMHFY